MSELEKCLPDPQSIVVLTREHIGDLICTTPALRALRHRYPNAHIAVEVGERAACVLENSPCVDEIILRPKSQGLAGKWKFIRLLRRRKFDMAVILDNCADFTLYVWLGNIPRRVGIRRKKKFARLLTDFVPFDYEAHEMVDNFRNVVALLGADISDASTEVFPSAQDRAAVEALWQEENIGPEEIVIGLNPGASAPSNRWLPERFAELGDLLLARPNYRVLLLGGPTDTDFAAAIQQNMTKKPIVLTGKLTLLQLAEAVRRCAVVVTGDTGPMHLTVAMKTPVVALFGPAVPHESGPEYAPGHTVIRKVDGCPACTKYICRANHECMRKITAPEVADAIDAALSRVKCY